MEPMYESPNSHIRHVVIDSKVVSKEKSAVYLTSGQEHIVTRIIAEDDGIDLLKEGEDKEDSSTSSTSSTTSLIQQETIRREMTQI